MRRSVELLINYLLVNISSSARNSKGTALFLEINEYKPIVIRRTLTLAFKHSNKQKIEGTGDRARQEYMVSYQYSATESFTFAPMLAIRHDNLEGDIHSTEWRFHPNMSYKLDDTFNLALDGFVAPVKRVDRNYSDIKH